MIYMYCSDADVETTYPTAEIINNLSKETTVSEPCTIEGIDEDELRLVTVNLTGGPVNAIEILQLTSQLKSIEDWVNLARNELV